MKIFLDKIRQVLLAQEEDKQDFVIVRVNLF